MQNSRSATSRIKKLLGRFVFWFFQKISDLVIEKNSGNIPSAPAIAQESRYLQDPLKEIVHDVVDILGYAGAMVATYEAGDALPVRALYINPEIAKIATEEQIKIWEKQASQFTSEPISLTDPRIARVYPHEDKYKNNLSVIAFNSGKPEIKDNLFSLFTPIAPKESEGAINLIQELLGITQVIAVPFFVNTAVSGESKLEFVGNLFAAKRENISKQDQEVLSSFAHYAASFILSEKRREQAEIIGNLILDIQKSLTDEKQVLERIVQGVVEEMGYAGAMVATYDDGDALPVKALYINPEIAKIATEEQIKIWEKQASQFTTKPISLTDPEIARVYPHQDEYQENLSVIAFNSGKPEIKDNLFSLFTPIAPKESEGAINLIQELLGIKRVIAVPFFLDDDFVGNLFAATRSFNITNWEIDILKAFGQQTAAGLRNVRLYRKTQELLETTEDLYKKGEDRRKSAEIFGKMAFTASASVHALKNHMGVVKGNLQLLKLGFDEEIKDMAGDALNRMEEKRDMASAAFKRVNDMIVLVNSLHEPAKIQNDTGVDVNSCINRAAERALGVDVPWVKKKLAQNCPLVKTIPEMLTEAFKVLIKNANESMTDVSEDRRLLEIESKLADGDIEVVIQDHGSGIEPENISKIFEMRYTTKESGLGFGLFWTKDYIEGLGGSIDVESVVGVGTKFCIRLPVANSATL